MKRSTKTFRIGAVAITAALLVACGGGNDEASDKPADTEVKVEETEKASTDRAKSKNAQALVDRCVEDGTSEDVCNCQIAAVEETLGKDDFSKLIDLAKNDDEEGAEQLMTEIMSEKPEIAMQMGMKMMSCTDG